MCDWLPADIVAEQVAIAHSWEVDHSRHVYFIGKLDRGPIKIGFAKNLTRRLWMLQRETGADVRVLAKRPGGRDLEGAYHLQFETARIGLEWFARTPEIEAEIKRLTISEIEA